MLCQTKNRGEHAPQITLFEEKWTRAVTEQQQQ
jgi:hypothetical protein